MSSNLRKVILRLSAVMLVALGILHIAVTSIISDLIGHNVAAPTADWLTPPMLLNHVVVGILLLPLGCLTFYAAPSAVLGERWALVVTRTISVAVAMLPATLFLIMGNRYFGAFPFVVATIIICAAALALLTAAFWPAPSSAARWQPVGASPAESGDRVKKETNNIKQPSSR